MAASSDVESCVGDTTVQRRQRLLGAATTRGAGVLQDGAIFCYEGAMGFLLDRGASTDAATGMGTAAGGGRDGERIQQRGTRGGGGGPGEGASRRRQGAAGVRTR